MFDAIAGAGWLHPATVDDLRTTFLEYFGAIIPGRPVS
jgi:hypothetical protein